MEFRHGDKLGLIAGNGRFPFLLLDAARAQGFAVTVAAIREETDPEINHRAAADERITVHWLSLGELSRLIEVFHKEGVSMAVMAGQVKHKQIFSSIRPDWRLAKLLLNLRTRNTDMLLGAVALAYFMTATAVILLHTGLSLIRQHIDADTNPSRRAVLNAAGSAPVATAVAPVVSTMAPISPRASARATPRYETKKRDSTGMALAILVGLGLMCVVLGAILVYVAFFR